MLHKVCLNCKHDFGVPDYRGHSAKYCSLDCKLNYKTVVKVCGYCKKKFKVPKCEQRLKCCSMECSKLLRKGKPTWNKGKTNCYSEKTLKLMSKKKKGKIPWIKGRKHSELTIEKLKTAKLKNPVRYWKNKKLPPHVIEMMKERNNGKWFREQNPNWANGKSWEKYPQEFNEEFKLKIKVRDRFKCLKCGVTEKDSINLFNRKLHVHHINYNKGINILENCCCLCVRCNAESNKNREQCSVFFQNLLSKMYGYTYDFIQGYQLDITKTSLQNCASVALLEKEAYPREEKVVEKIVEFPKETIKVMGFSEPVL